MTSLPLVRTEYWNLSTGTVRGGPTGHGESLTDVERYLIPAAQTALSSLYTWGVADGLTVVVNLGQSGLTVAPGAALDAAGHLISLAAGGVAVVDQAVDPDQVANVPTVPVETAGVVLPTTDLAGERDLTVTWREVLGQSPLDNAPTLIHAPWLRLLPPADVPETGEQVFLARVTVAADGTVTGLNTGRRRLVGGHTGRLELRMPRLASGPPSTAGQRPAATLRVRDDGGLSVDLSRPDGTARPTLSIDNAGRVGIGVSAGPNVRSLQVEGSEIHSGGPGGGLSFADRQTGSFVDAPAAGERWVWYAGGGTARLWSGTDRLSVSATGEGGGLDVGRRMRVRQGGDGSAGIWLHQTGPQQDRAFVGMAGDTSVGFYGTGCGWGLRMDTDTARVTFTGDFGRPDGPATLSLFGSTIGDTGGGRMFIRSGGNVVAFDGGDSVGIGTASPGAPLHVVGSSTAIIGRGGTGFLASGVSGQGPMAMFANGDNNGIWASGRSNGVIASAPQGGLAGNFFGDVRISGTLSKGGGGFRIDHPAEPGNRYLTHSFVEAPERLNLYRGEVTTGDDGTATVELPGYFDALNADPTCQLTVVGEPALAGLAEPVHGNRFTVRTDRPGVTVSWLVLGVRQDAWARANPLTVEEDKPDDERDHYLHPQAHDRDPSRGLAYAQFGPDVAGTVQL